MKVTVFGAGGRTGRLVVERAVKAGHTVTAFVHNDHDFQRQDLRVIAGDVTNPEAVRSALGGQDAAIFAIGSHRAYETTDMETRAARTIVDAMQAQGVRRLIVISMLGVGDSKKQAPFWYERLLLPTYLRGAAKDKAGMESNVSASGLDFVIVRPPVLTSSEATGTTTVLEGDTTAHKITRADLAQFLVDQLRSDTYLGRIVTVANK